MSNEWPAGHRSALSAWASPSPHTGQRSSSTTSASTAPPPLAAAPHGLALLREGLHSLAEVLGGEAGFAQLDELALQLLGESQPSELADHPLVAGQGQRRVRGDLRREVEHALVELAGLYDPVDEPHLAGSLRVDGAAEEEEL